MCFWQSKVLRVFFFFSFAPPLEVTSGHQYFRTVITFNLDPKKWEHFAGRGTSVRILAAGRLLGRPLLKRRQNAES